MKKKLWGLLTALNIHHLWRFINRQKITIIMYHGVIKEPLPIPCWWQLPYGEFKWQVEYLKKHYTVMPLQELMLKIQRQEALPENAAVITFDDGFENNYSMAFPLLKELALPATIFLTTDYIGTDSLLWPDELYMLFLETKAEKIDLKDLGLGDFGLRTVKEKQAAFNAAIDHLKSLGPKDKNAMIVTIRKALSPSMVPGIYRENFKLLSWQHIEEMNASGLIHWGAHTCSHAILSHLDDNTLNNEIRNSCARVRRFDGHLLFAYPNGRKQDFDDRAKAILKQLNVLCALTTVAGLNPRSQDPYALMRIGIGDKTSRDHFKLLCSGII